jgi:hypothetical protein
MTVTQSEASGKWAHIVKGEHYLIVGHLLLCRIVG